MPANPGYAFNQVRLGAYYFSARGAYRTDDVFSSDVAVTYDIPYQRMQLFSKAEVTNLFDRAAVVNVDTEVVTRLSNAGSGLLPFNPFTATPVEGINYRLGPNFGKPTGPESYQTPRTFRLSLGVRF